MNDSKKYYITLALLIITLVLSFLFVGCSAQQHIKKAKKHAEKAIKKGAKITPDVDTLVINKIDTLTEVRNDTVFTKITETVTETITKDGEIRYITKSDKRKERRLEKDLRDKEHKLKKLQAKLDAKTEVKKTKHTEKTKQVQSRTDRKSKWWASILLFFLGCLVGFAIAKLPQIKDWLFIMIQNKTHKQ